MVRNQEGEKLPLEATVGERVSEQREFWRRESGSLIYNSKVFWNFRKALALDPKSKMQFSSNLESQIMLLLKEKALEILLFFQRL